MKKIGWWIEDHADLVIIAFLAVGIFAVFWLTMLSPNSSQVVCSRAGYDGVDTIGFTSYCIKIDEDGVKHWKPVAEVREMLDGP